MMLTTDMLWSLWNKQSWEKIIENMNIILRPHIRNSLFSFEGQLCTFSWVLSLLGRYFYNMYIAKTFEIVLFFLMLRKIIYFHVYIILDFPITYRIASVLCQSECACLHKTVNMVVFFDKSNENTFQKWRALMQMYRVVPITKRGNMLRVFLSEFHLLFFSHSLFNRFICSSDC